MALNMLKTQVKKFGKLYSFLWGMPLYRKTMSCIQNRIKNNLSKDGLSGIGLVSRSLDMFLSLCLYGCNYAEYNWYNFKNLPHSKRKEYIGDCCRRKYYAKLNDLAEAECLRNKFLSFQKFYPFYGRRAVVYRLEQDFDCFREIIRSFGVAMVKPASTSGGYGIIKVTAVTEESIRNSYDLLCSAVFRGEFIIEEYVTQAAELRNLHPSSLNTARIITVIDRDGVPHILGTLFRIGKDGMVVDNGASGGLLCKISDNGTIEYCVDKKNNQSYTHHPTTNHPLIGFTIPRWEEAKNLALQLALHVPAVRYCGWDLALTSDGWIMVEGNEGAELAGIQIMNGGCKSALTRYI